MKPLYCVGGPHHGKLIAVKGPHVQFPRPRKLPVYVKPDVVPQESSVELDEYDYIRADFVDKSLHVASEGFVWNQVPIYEQKRLLLSFLLSNIIAQGLPLA